MARQVWQFGLVILICCVFIFVLAIFSLVDAQVFAMKGAAPDSLGDWQAVNHVFASEEGILIERASTPAGDTYLPVIFGNLSSKQPVFKGDLAPEDLIISALAADTSDRWTVDLVAGDMISITVAPGNSVDIMLSILDSDGLRLVDQQNLSPSGEVETITDLSITNPGIYDLLVQTVQGEQTDYALMLMDQDSYSFVFRGTLLDNDSRSDSLPVDVDHFWFFNAKSSESVSFTITPDTSGDAYVELYSPTGSRMLTIDDTAEGEPESLENYLLLDSGLYGIRVAEFDFLAMHYQLDFSKP